LLDINLKQLEVFVAAAEYNSFTKAAEMLYLSQSTVSAHIRGLEDALGVTLFLRSAKKKIEVTEAGKRCYGPAKEILDRCRMLQSSLTEEQTVMLSVGASTVPAQYLLPRLLADFSRKKPDCRFLMKRGDSMQIHEMLRTGEIQAGFVGMRLDEKEFDYYPVLQDRLVLVTENSQRFRSLPADMGEKLCPYCKRAYIAEDEDMCEQCREERKYMDEPADDIDIDKDEEWRNYLDDDEKDIPVGDDIISFSQLADEEKNDEFFRDDEEEEEIMHVDDEPDDFDIEIDERDFEDTDAEEDEDDEDDDDDFDI
jgi:DNA-binding MarR family transcriptional regulator